MQPATKLINESGLYELLSISTKPLAKLFMNKYFAEIMPTIRRTGKYILDIQDKIKLNKINKKIQSIKNSSKKVLNKVREKLSSIKKSNKDLIINQTHIDYPEGNHLYIIKQKTNSKTYYKIGYTKNLNNRIKTYNTGNANKIYFNYIIKIFTKETDKCIKQIMRNQEYIKNKEFYKVSLKSALNFINKCDDTLNNILCGYCLKKYRFDTISIHKCKLVN